jgi:NADH-quinone oxidoreductase subunit L
MLGIFADHCLSFYSKDMIIEAVHFSSLPYADWVYYAVVVGVFITAF